MDNNIILDRFSLLDRTYKQIINSQIKKYDLTIIQYKVLSEIYRLECSQALNICSCMLQKIVHVSQPTLTGIIKRLENKGFIKTEQSKEDLRYKVIGCTSRSVDIIKKIKKEERRILSELYKGIDDLEIETVLKVSNNLLENIKNIAWKA